MPKITRRGGVSREDIPAPFDPELEASPVVDEVEAVLEDEPIVVDEHGDDAAAVEGVSVLVGEPGPELDVPPAAGDVVDDTPPDAPAAPARTRRSAARG